MKKKKKVKVLLLQPWPEPGNVYYTVSLLEQLGQINGIEVSAILNWDFPSRLKIPNVSVSYFPMPYGIRGKNILWITFQPLTFLWFVLRLFFAKASILHINYTHPWVALLYPLLTLRFKVVHTLHDVKPHIGEERLYTKLNNREAAHLAHRIIVHGENLKSVFVQSYGIDPERVVVIPHGNMKYTMRFGSKETVEENGTLLFAGRILPYKGLEYLLEAMDEVLMEFPHVKLIIAGSGDLEPYREKIKTQKENIEVHNRVVSDGELADLFRRSPIVVVPYAEGSQSGPLITAFTFGKAVVATRVGSFADVIKDGENGLLVPPRDARALAEAIKKLLREPESRLYMAQKAKEFALKELDWGKIAKETSKIYYGLA
jgi:starch synthase